VSRPCSISSCFRSHLIDYQEEVESTRVDALICAVVAHISSWKVRIALWDKYDAKCYWRDARRNTAAITYPTGFDHYVIRTFHSLQQEQRQLLNHLPEGGAVKRTLPSQTDQKAAGSIAAEAIKSSSNTSPELFAKTNGVRIRAVSSPSSRVYKSSIDELGEKN